MVPLMAKTVAPSAGERPLVLKLKDVPKIPEKIPRVGEFGGYSL